MVGSAMAVLLLILLVAALSGPLPSLLARSRLANRHPGPAIIAWFGLGGLWASSLAGVLVMVVRESAGVAASAAVVLAVPFAASLLAARDAALGARHAARLRMVGRWDPRSRMLVVPAGVSLAYTLPTWDRGIVVTTDACLAGLGPDERRALLAHERAHADGRHHVVIAWFTAWRTLAPGLPGPRIAADAVSVLVEVAADRAACRAAGPAATASALFRQGRGADDSGPWHPPPGTLTRLRSLAAWTPSPSAAGRGPARPGRARASGARHPGDRQVRGHPGTRGARARQGRADRPWPG